MASVDYWRVCSFSDQDYYQLLSWQASQGQSKAGRFLQYSGKTLVDTPLFLGKAEQIDKNGEIRRHYLCQHSGSDSHRTYTMLRQHSYRALYATRIDIQRTIRHDPKLIPWRQLADTLTGKISLIQSETSTLYVGARTSDNFCRLYEKDGGFLRLEFETKGQWSQRFYAGPPDLNAVYAFLLARSPLPESIKSLFSLQKDDNEKFVKEQLEKDKHRKLQWLRSIMPAIEKMAFDHVMGPETIALIEAQYMAVLQWREYSEKLDK